MVPPTTKILYYYTIMKPVRKDREEQGGYDLVEMELRFLASNPKRMQTIGDKRKEGDKIRGEKEVEDGRLCCTNLSSTFPESGTSMSLGRGSLLAHACAGYLPHLFSKETEFTFEFRPCDPSFPAFLQGSRSLQEGHGCLVHDGFSDCSPGAIHLLSRCDWPSPALLLCVSEAVFRCAGSSTCTIHS